MLRAFFPPTMTVTLALAILAAVCTLSPPAVCAIDIVCHRGANEHAPENTYASSQLCLDWGVAYVEIDVRTSRDGVMYIIHDPTVNRTTNGSGLVSQLTSQQIDQLDAGSWFDASFADQRVPRLEPYLRWIKGRAKVYFDVKHADLKQLIDLVYDVGLENDCFFWFSADARAREFRELDQKLALKINASSPDDVQRAHDEFAADIVEVGLDRASPELIDTCRRLRIKLMIYHPQKDADAFRSIVELNPDMINLNHGDLFQQIEREVRAAQPASR